MPNGDKGWEAWGIPVDLLRLLHVLCDGLYALNNDEEIPAEKRIYLAVCARRLKEKLDAIDISDA